jgi:hypothetical protein
MSRDKKKQLFEAINRRLNSVHDGKIVRAIARSEGNHVTVEVVPVSQPQPERPTSFSPLKR